TATAIPPPDPNSAAWNLYLDSQTFNLTGLDGTPIAVSLTEINAYIYWLVSQVGMWGCTVGITGTSIVVLCILTTSKKARRPIFILNFINLFLLCLLGIFKLGILCSQYNYGVGEVWIGAMTQYPVPFYATPNVFASVIRIILFPTI